MADKYQPKALPPGAPDPKLAVAIRSQKKYPMQPVGFVPPKPIYTVPKDIGTKTEQQFGFQGPDSPGIPPLPAMEFSAEAPIGFVASGMADNSMRTNDAPTRIKAGFEAPAPTGIPPRSPGASARPRLGFAPAKDAGRSGRTHSGHGAHPVGFQGSERTAARDGDQRDPER
ncbi:hypothetical protein ACIRL2_32635 [Embleya sp. NPDC127516]|uniref:hypothetical protein n=1 Tax=Embleya sp. NPDC127516 TaxID=3363990 RepID=UPI003808E48B